MLSCSGTVIFRFFHSQSWGQFTLVLAIHWTQLPCLLALVLSLPAWGSLLAFREHRTPLLNSHWFNELISRHFLQNPCQPSSPQFRKHADEWTRGTTALENTGIWHANLISSCNKSGPLHAESPICSSNPRSYNNPDLLYERYQFLVCWDSPLGFLT
jgi:hypothetical protein